MEHVVVRLEDDGYWLDPSAYLAILPSLARDLPPGASEFALDPQHYDFVSDRSVHDLWFRSLRLDDADGAASLSFGHSGEKHAYGLSLVYPGLVRIVVDRQRDPGVERLGQLLLDELRPSPDGFVHEFAMTGGSLLVVARDLEAVWG
jgi:hypothetical protein